ncbi:deoxynucleoside kinase isoform X2 [Eurytemora carolleeae]|uniref:deoxynucleoside kinase isoform X2 n=1 Tax=Eurytemora carolleeae TaxID=1294199 RepID=UPI000C77DDC9|nr:deoxynucleoside kinase isoform X2 [Eurytemora carolleeae]|eukprot:XP_023326396.1 deoxynucleoside kinase-like isoform X2 [Eurytemora affinis]
MPRFIQLQTLINTLETILKMPGKTHFPPDQLQNGIPKKCVPDLNKENKKKPFIVSIEGNIGSGKSTMLKYFERYSDVELIPEPVAEWCDVNGHNLLGKMYQDPKRWSFQFQSYVQLTRLQLLKKPTDCSVKIIERSLQNNRYCFLENHRREETLAPAELSVLYNWFDFLKNNMDIHLDLIVYLRTSPQVAYDRLRERGRKEESGVPMEFIQHLHQCYEDWLITEKFGSPPAPVLILDADQGMDSMLKIFEKYKDEIRGVKPYTADELIPHPSNPIKI